MDVELQTNTRLNKVKQDLIEKAKAISFQKETAALFKEASVIRKHFEKYQRAGQWENAYYCGQLFINCCLEGKLHQLANNCNLKYAKESNAILKILTEMVNEMEECEKNMKIHIRMLIENGAKFQPDEAKQLSENEDTESKEQVVMEEDTLSGCKELDHAYSGDERAGDELAGNENEMTKPSKSHNPVHDTDVSSGCNDLDNSIELETSLPIPPSTVVASTTTIVNEQNSNSTRKDETGKENPIPPRTTVNNSISEPIHNNSTGDLPHADLTKETTAQFKQLEIKPTLPIDNKMADRLSVKELNQVEPEKLNKTPPAYTSVTHEKLNASAPPPMNVPPPAYSKVIGPPKIPKRQSKNLVKRTEGHIIQTNEHVIVDSCNAPTKPIKDDLDANASPKSQLVVQSSGDIEYGRKNAPSLENIVESNEAPGNVDTSTREISDIPPPSYPCPNEEEFNISKDNPSANELNRCNAPPNLYPSSVKQSTPESKSTSGTILPPPTGAPPPYVSVTKPIPQLKEPLKKGMKVSHTRSSGEQRFGNIVAVHDDDAINGYFYTVLFEDGNTVQTEANRLKVVEQMD